MTAVIAPIEDDQVEETFALAEALDALARALGEFVNHNGRDDELQDIAALQIMLWARRAAPAFSRLLQGDLLDGLGKLGDGLGELPISELAASVCLGGCRGVGCVSSVVDRVAVSHDGSSRVGDGEADTSSSVVQTLEDTPGTDPSRAVSGDPTTAVSA